MNINVGNNFLNIRKFQGSYGDFFIVKYIIYFYIIYCEKTLEMLRITILHYLLIIECPCIVLYPSLLLFRYTISLLAHHLIEKGYNNNHMNPK